MRWLVIFVYILCSIIINIHNIYAQPTSSYLLGPEDVVRIVIWDHPDLSGEFKIDPAGNIPLLLLGEVKAEGLTTEELEKVLYEKLSKYIAEPRISVTIIGYHSKKVYILGEVSNPGKYSIGGEYITLRDAILKAGLPTRDADLRRVKIITPGKVQPKVRIVNLYNILYKGKLDKNIKLNSGDVVYVPMKLLPKIGDMLGRIASPFIQYLSIRNIFEDILGLRREYR
jgi:polysaccharide export outer membrane protein